MKELKQLLSLHGLPLASPSSPLEGEVMLFDEPVATFKDGKCVFLDYRRAPALIQKGAPLEQWLLSRLLDLSRGNSPKLLNELKVTDALNAVLSVNARSLTDFYWFKPLKSKKRHVSAKSLPDVYGDLALKGVGIKKALPDTEEQALVFLFVVSSQVSADEYMSLLNDFIAQYPESPDGYLRRATQQLALAQDEASMEKVEADLDKALKVARQEDDVYYNRARTIYNYLLTNPAAPYKGWTFDTALQEVRSAIGKNNLPLYMQLEADILFAKQDYAGASAVYEKVNATNFASAATYYSAARTKQLMQAPQEETLALMDSCVSRLATPFTPTTIMT